MCRILKLKSQKRNDKTPAKYDEITIECARQARIVETARRIIDEAKKNGEGAGYNDYCEKNGRHPIFGFINFIVRRTVYNFAYDALLNENDKELDNPSCTNYNKWLEKFKPNRREIENGPFLTNAVDPMISSYSNRDETVASFSFLGYSNIHPVKEEGSQKVMLMQPFGIGVAHSMGMHSALSLNMRCEYRFRVTEIVDFSDVVNEWEFKDGVFKKIEKDVKNKKTVKEEVIGYDNSSCPEPLFILTVLLFKIGKLMVENGIEWTPYKSPTS